MAIKIGNLDISSVKVGSADCAVYLGTTKLYPQSSPTPSYTLLQGIERKEGYLGYVDLGLKVGIDFVIDITLNYKTAAGGRIFGDSNTFRWFLAGSKAYFDYNGNRISIIADTYYPLNTDYTVTLRNYSMKSSLNSVVTTGETQTSYDAPNTVCIFSTNITSNGDLGIIYNVKIYTNNGSTLVGDFIPVKRNSDNLVTLFNTVTNTFCDVYGSLYPIEIISFDGKYKFTLTDDSVVSGECNSSSSITSDETSEYTATLKEVVIGDCVTSLSSDAFANCNGLTSIEIPDTVTSIGNSVFRDCRSLTGIVIPDSVTSIGASAFDSCKKLSSITIPNNVTSIGNTAFANCTGLTSCTIGSGVTSIGVNAFRLCTRLTSTNIPDSVTSIGDYAFYGCSSLTSIDIPNGVTSIGRSAFYDCRSLTSCTIGSGVTSIGVSAFERCTGLTSITVNATTPPTLGTNAFASTNDCPIYVPSASVNAYKASWATYASRIYAISRLPSGYTEVEYVQNTGTSVINSNFQPNSNTRIVGEMEMVTSNDYPKIFGAGVWNNSASLFAEYDNYLAVHWINTNSSTKYSSYKMSTFAYAKHKYDINKGSFYVDETLVGTHTYSSTLSVSSPVGIFNYINGTTPGNTNEYFLGKLYSFKIYNNDVLARDFVPAIRNSDSTVGLYDVVNDVFYTSTTPLVAPPSA